MNNKNHTREEILSQIKYLEQNISNGSPAYRANRVRRIHALRSSLRNACWSNTTNSIEHIDWKAINHAFLLRNQNIKI